MLKQILSSFVAIGMLATGSTITSCQKSMQATTATAPTEMGKPKPPEKLPPYYISDLALIYQGGTHRLPWTSTHLKPFVFRTPTTGFEWLFDGFLFIEFKDNLGYEYAEGYGQQPAGKAQWLWLLQRNFEDGKAIKALNGMLDSLSAQGKTPERKRKVVLTLPEPIRSTANWGELNGRQLNFAVAADRVAACQWFIDTAMTMWNAANLQHLELMGFYWVAEHNTGAAEILPSVSAKIHERNKRFYWIPYYGADGAGSWQSMGFDIAYQQPNYFFDLNSPYSILTGAIRYAQQHSMALEMEFDNRLITDAGYQKKYTDYINEFEKAGAWRNLPVAYYEGGGGWYEMSLQTDPTVTGLFKRLAEIISTRQKDTDVRSR